MSREYNQPVSPRCVSNLCTSQQDLIRTYWDLFRDVVLGEELQSAFVCIEGVVGVFGTEATSQCGNKMRGSEVSGLGRCLLDLQVGFTEYERLRET